MGLFDVAECGQSNHVRLYCTTQAFFFNISNPTRPTVVHNPGQLIILRPAGLQIFSRRDALGLTRKWALRNNKWDVIIKTGQ